MKDSRSLMPAGMQSGERNVTFRLIVHELSAAEDENRRSPHQERKFHFSSHITKHQEQPDYTRVMEACRSIPSTSAESKIKSKRCTEMSRILHKK